MSRINGVSGNQPADYNVEVKLIRQERTALNPIWRKS